MAFLPGGLKKQLNKANQFLTENITGAEGTKLDSDFHEMEKRTDLVAELSDDLQVKTKEYLQPNPTIRTKMAAVKGISKLSGQAKASTYPQPEGTLGEAMCTHGRKLQECGHGFGIFGSALGEAGETMKQMADLKYTLDDHVKQSFLEPLHYLNSKEIREVAHHRKKLQGHKLDFDCKKRQGATGAELQNAEDKFANSFNLAQVGMHNLVADNGVEQISQLTQFAEAVLEYHRNCTSLLEQLTETLREKTNEAASRPRDDFRPKTLVDLGIARNTNGNNTLHAGGGYSSATSPGTSPAGTPVHGRSAWDSAPPPRPTSPRPSPATTPTRQQQPSCKALYDFQAENPGELSFREGDTILLKRQIDDNWFDGTLHGKGGYLPVNYVQVVVPLP